MPPSLWQAIVFLIAIPLLFLPSIIAIKRQHPHKVPIIVLNVLGWPFMGLGWIAAFFWAILGGKKQAGETL